MEYYGDWCLSFLAERDTLQNFYNTVDEMLIELSNMTQAEFYDIHVMKYDSEYGYEVITTFLKED